LKEKLCDGDKTERESEFFFLELFKKIAGYLKKGFTL
jgi:hypothetical protein